MEAIGQQLLGTTAAWANSAAQNTKVQVDVSASEPGQSGRLDRVRVTIRNPSTITALIVTAKVAYLDPADGTTVRYAKLTSFTVAVKGTSPDDGGESFLLDGLTLGRGGRLQIENATALGGSDAFTASVVVTRAA